MLIAYWIVAGLAAVAFFGAGGMKLLRPKPALQQAGLGWVEDFPTPAVKLIAAAEVAGAIGLILPMLTGLAAVLSPIAGAYLAILMIGAIVVHLRRQEPFFSALIPGILAAAAAVLGFLILS